MQTHSMADVLTLSPQLVSFRALVPEITSTSYLTHSIYYYPAKFIPQVVRYCLNEYTPKNGWVIDPFAGSGTVGLEANLCHRNAILLDLNLLLNHIIPIKMPQTKQKLQGQILQQKWAQVFATTAEFIPAWSNLAYWYPPEILELLQKLWAGQKSLEPDLYAQIIQAALVRMSKQFSYAEHKAPKLFKSKSKQVDMANLLQRDWRAELRHELLKLGQEMLLSINQYLEVTQDNPSQVVFYGGVDSSTFQWPDPIALDALITSPPYLQAQEYIRTVKLDLYWLGYAESEVQRISKLEIPYRRATEVITTETLDKVKAQLTRPDLHKVLDSYFCHTLKALDQASQRLKPGGKACIFVGNPKVDGLEVETWRIIMEYFMEKQFAPYAIFEDKIKMRQLFKARKNKNPDGMTSEYLLVLEKK